MNIYSSSMDGVYCLNFDRRCTGWRRLLTGKDMCPLALMALWSMHVRRLFVRLVFS